MVVKKYALVTYKKENVILAGEIKDYNLENKTITFIPSKIKLLSTENEEVNENKLYESLSNNLKSCLIHGHFKYADSDNLSVSIITSDDPDFIENMIKKSNDGSDNMKFDKVGMMKEVTSKIYETYAKKNRDYGDSFSETIKELGLVAGLVPLHNKLNRAKTLITSGKSNFESLDDTLLDLATYALMLKIENEIISKKKVNTDTIKPIEGKIVYRLDSDEN